MSRSKARSSAGTRATGDPPPGIFFLGDSITFSDSIVERAIHRLLGSRRTLSPPKGGRYGTMLLRTLGRRSGKPREAILGYCEDGPNLVTLAMNGWGEAEPAWWLNLQARPDAEVELKDGPRLVHARTADGAERDRLWDMLRALEKNLDAYATRRPGGTAVVILKPRPAP